MIKKKHSIKPAPTFIPITFTPTRKKSGKLQEVLFYNREYLFWEYPEWSKVGNGWKFSMTNEEQDTVISCFKRVIMDKNGKKIGMMYIHIQERSLPFYVKDTLTDDIYIVNSIDCTAELMYEDEKEFLRIQKLLRK